VEERSWLTANGAKQTKCEKEVLNIAIRNKRERERERKRERKRDYRRENKYMI